MEVKRAGLSICLFLCSLTLPAQQEWSFDDRTGPLYHQVLNLQTADVLVSLPSPETPQEHYVAALAEALELLLTEDPVKFSEYEEHFEQRLDRKIKTNNPNELFLLAELHLQWAFIYLKFGHEFDAALNFRQSYLTAQEIKERFPKYQAIKKTSGLLDIIIGSIPEKYNWVLGLLNMQGTVSLGLDDFESIRKSDHPLAFEGSMLYALTQGFVLQKTEVGYTLAKEILDENPRNRLALLLAASLAMKNSSSEVALGYLQTFEALPVALPVHYVNYLEGEIWLHKAQYLNAISSYRAFINIYTGQNHVKDAYYKIGLCYWLNGNKNDAMATFKEARSKGKESSEADKYAARSLESQELPHIGLTKARFFTDGGYYDEAKAQLESITPSALPTQRDKAEFEYRRARLAHKTNDLSQARSAYIKTIDLTGSEEWYFAPNACLQLGYMAWKEGNNEDAKTYFNRALKYKRHEYKNSIDSKARSALSQLQERK
jgi:TolA-binding protein